jgi:hypothetical protein
MLYPSHTGFRSRCTPLAPERCVTPPRHSEAMTRRRALLSGTRSAPRFPENPCATGIRPGGHHHRGARPRAPTARPAQRCSRPGRTSTWCSAASASPARSCRRARCWPPTRSRTTRHRQQHVRQHLPLRHLRAHPPGHPQRRRITGLSVKETTMSNSKIVKLGAADLSRRAFLKTGRRRRRPDPGPVAAGPGTDGEPGARRRPRHGRRRGRRHGRLLAQRLRAHRHRRQRDGHLQAPGDGPGHLHRPADPGGRGTGRPLGSDRPRGRAGGLRALQQPVLGPGAGHRRQHGHRQRLRADAQGRRRGPAMLVAAAAGALAGAGGGDQRHRRRRQPSASGQAGDLRRAGRGRGGQPVPEEPKLKDPSAFKLIGKARLPRKDSAAKCTAVPSSPRTCGCRTCSPPASPIRRCSARQSRASTTAPPCAIDGVEQVVQVPTGVAVLGARLLVREARAATP